jgi:hypothetical protein
MKNNIMITVAFVFMICSKSQGSDSKDIIEMAQSKNK